MKVYVAGALSNKEKVERTPSKVVVDYFQNVNKMVLAGRALIKAGHAPFIPALDLVTGIAAGDMEEEDYRRVDIEFMIACDAVVVISHSSGVERELGIADAMGIPVYEGLEAFLKEHS